MLETVDTNGDGALSAEELAAGNDRLTEKLLEQDTADDRAVRATYAAGRKVHERLPA